MEPYGNDLQTHIGDSDIKSMKGKRVSEDLSYSLRRGGGAQSLNLQTEGQTSSRRRHNQEIYHQRRTNSIENTIPEPKIRKKNPTYCSLEPLANFPEEDREKIMKDRYMWKRCQQVSIEGPRFQSFSHKCTHPGCTMRMHTERIPLHPDKITVPYEGVHKHNDIHALPGQLPVQIASQKPFSCRDLEQFPCISVCQNKKFTSQYEVQKDKLQRLQSTVYIMKLDQYIEQLKPNYGIFIEQTSKIKYGVLDDHVAKTNGTICGMSSSQGGYGEPHQAYNVHSPPYSNSVHNPYQYHSQQLQQVNNTECHSIPFPGLFSSAEPSISLGIQCTNPVMAGGEINFHYNLMQRNLNIGYYTFKPFTYEQPSSSLMAGGGYRDSGVIDEAEQFQWIHPSYAQLNGSLTEN